MKKEKKKVFPKLSKKINAFLVGEEGKISKESLIKAGVIASGLAITTISLAKSASAQHTNDLNLDYNNDTGSAHAQHNNATSHSSHSNGGM